jgi:hypothetical protein
MQALVADVKAGWIVEMKWGQSNALKYVFAKVEMLESQFPPYTETLAILGTAGSSGDYKSYNASVIRILTNQKGRKGRGRQYIGGMASNLTDFGVFKSAIASTWATHLANCVALYGPGGSSAFRLGVHGRLASAPFYDMVNLVLNPVEGLQRRRNIGVGI